MVTWLLILACLLLPGAAFAQEASYSFNGKDAVAAITSAIAGAGSGNEVRVSLMGSGNEEVFATATAPITAQVDGLDVDKTHERWEATLLLSTAGRNLAPVKIAGRFDEMLSVPVLRRRMQSGDVIAQDDIDWSSEPATHVRQNTITDAHELVGKSPKRAISPGRPIRQEEIANPALISKGARVTLYFRSGNIDIKTLGEAIDSGAKGDVIRVKNLTSKTVVQGTVETSNSVRVSTADSTSAEAM